MDYVTQDWPPELIQCWFNLTDRQLADIMDYIKENRPELEAEYQSVVQQAEDIRKYWKDRNQERFAKIAAMPHKSGKEELWARLEAQKARLEKECR